MRASSARRGVAISASLAVGAAALTLAGCPSREPAVVAKDPQKYGKIVSAFYSGVTALLVNSQARAEAQLKLTTELAPKEPAGWANLGLHFIRSQNYAEADKALKRARELAPNNADIQLYSALLEGNQGHIEPAITYLRQAIAFDPRNIEARGRLIEQLERLAAPGTEQEVEREYEQILEVAPDNIKARMELARLAAKNGDRTKLLQQLDALAPQAKGWRADAAESLRSLRARAATAEPRSLITDVQRTHNVAKQVVAYTAHHAALGTSGEMIGTPIQHFLTFPQPAATPAPRDESLTFQAEPAASAPASWAVVHFLSPALPPDVGLKGGETPPPAGPDAAPQWVYPQGGKLALGAGDQSSLPLPGTIAAPAGVLPLDWDNDYRPDLILAGTGGVRLFHQEKTGSWTEVTARAGLPAAVLGAPYSGAWSADFDLDGDLDVVLGSPKGEALGLRNNGNGTWAPVRPFSGVTGVRDFAWADLDGDGDPDAALLDGQGRLTVLLNGRGGQFKRADLGETGGSALALSIADANHEGTLDLVVLRSGGAIEAVSSPDGTQWKSTDLVSWTGAPASGSVRLLWGDLDNNGGLDLVASGPKSTQVWLLDEQRVLQPLGTQPEAQVFGLEDLNEDGRLDLVGLAPDQKPVRLLNQGKKAYHWQALRPRSNSAAYANNKINAFGIGGEAELRSGLLVQKQLIASPRVHFGLGEYGTAEVVRIAWPNGEIQAEFELAADGTPLAVQRLSGSCPWLFAHDGKEIKFVTDVLWKSPLGLRINAQDTAGVSQTRDWVKVRGDQLAPVDGYYDLRVTAELWETDFFDHTSLMVVDHPAGTEILVDERFSIPQPKLEVLVAQPPVPVKRATDQDGTDVTAIVAKRDARYLDTFKLGRYQGLAQDHFVEVELPDGVGTDGQLWLLGNGWIFPTDSSINVAISQGTEAPPQGLSLEVPDGKGGWKTARQGLGFPAGKYKTVRLDLTGLFPAGTPDPRKLRLRTNLEIYWDQLTVTAPAEISPSAYAAQLRTREILPETAELRYRGFSEVRQPRRSYPETPDYNQIAGTAPKWLDLVGHYTRFGDVRELVTKVDDRYVIMNAGDELRLRFPAAPAPDAGWVRDYIFVSDGWDKDGNFNTSYSTTLLPLPSHDRPDYNTPPTPLDADPVYRRYPQDWLKYHTRYISTESFRKALRLPVRPRPRSTPQPDPGRTP